MSQNEFYKYATGHLGINSMVMHDYTRYFNQQFTGQVPGIQGLTPNIIEERKLNIAIMDVFSRLMKDRIIFLGMGIDDQVANVVTAQLLFLETTEEGDRDIQIFINSPGGSVYAGLGIYDTMQHVRPNVATTCTGLAASMGAVLLCAGEPGKRFALPHSRIMIHQPLGGAQGQATEIRIIYEEIEKLKQELYNIISFHSGQTYEQVEKDSDRDHWMRAEEARDYGTKGLIDEVMGGRPQPFKGGNGKE